MIFSASSLLAGLLLSASLTPSAAFERGLAWATNNQFVQHRIAHNPLIHWYHHWQDGPVPGMPSAIEFVPMFWGPKYWGQWDQELGRMRQSPPKHLMAFNEPDIQGQSNMNPYYAAQLYMEQIQPWASKGTTLVSPAIVWNLNWMATFLNEVHNKGGHVDIIALHWYGSHNDIQGLKQFVQTAHARFNKPIWITEVGITSSSYPSTWQVKNFVMNSVFWMEQQYYIKRVAWFGCFEVDHPPDYFASAKNALLKAGGYLSDLGFWYVYTTAPNKRSLSARHHILSRQDEDLDNANQNVTVVHCDDICQKRNAQIAEYLASVA